MPSVEVVPPEVAITLYRGDSTDVAVSLTGEVLPTPTWSARVYDRVGGSQVLSVTVTGTSSTGCTLSFSSADTKTIADALGATASTVSRVYDVQQKSGALVRTVLRGTLSVVRDVTPES